MLVQELANSVDIGARQITLLDEPPDQTRCIALEDPLDEITRARLLILRFGYAGEIDVTAARLAACDEVLLL